MRNDPNEVLLRRYLDKIKMQRKKVRGDHRICFPAFNKNCNMLEIPLKCKTLLMSNND